MKASVTVRFDGGTCRLPAGTPYEAEVLLEYVSYCVTRQRSIVLRQGRQRWRVDRRPELLRCASCHRETHLLVHAGRHQGVCWDCARPNWSADAAERCLEPHWRRAGRRGQAWRASVVRVLAWVRGECARTPRISARSVLETASRPRPA